MTREDLLRLLESAEWGRVHWLLFSAISLNYFLDGVVFAIAPLTVYLVAPEELALPILASNLIAETVGAFFFGAFADRRGRKVSLILMNTLQAVPAALLLLFYSNHMALWVLTSLLSFSVGGDFGASYAALAEFVPARFRGRAVLLSTNFWNIGSAGIAGGALVFAAIYQDPAIQAQYIFLTTLATLGLVALIRLTIPESPRWLLRVGRTGDAERVVFQVVSGRQSTSGLKNAAGQGHDLAHHVGLAYRFTILSVATISQYVTYGMLAYYAPYAPGFRFGVESAPTVIFVANLGASVGALLLWPLIDRGRRVSALLSFLLGTLTAASVYYAHASGNVLAFYATLFSCLVFSEWAWGSVSALQSELFPTGIRATAIGVLTGLTGISGASVLLIQGYLSAEEFLAASIIIWGLGLAATIAWAVRGLESANRVVEDLEPHERR